MASEQSMTGKAWRVRPRWNPAEPGHIAYGPSAGKVRAEQLRFAREFYGRITFADIIVRREPEGDR